MHSVNILLLPYNNNAYVSIFENPINYLAVNHDVKIQPTKGMPNHIHLLVSFKPKLAPSDVVKSLKGPSLDFAYGLRLTQKQV